MGEIIVDQRRKSAILSMRTAQGELDSAIIYVVEDFFPIESQPDDDAQWYDVSTLWECPKSPFGWCAYHIIHDKMQNNCVFCHLPQERK